MSEVDNRAVAEVGAEPEQVVGIGAVPAVDGLVGVADDAEVLPAVQPGVQEGELQGVDILEFVHVQVPEAPALGIGEALVAGEGLSATVQQVVEVDQVPLLLGVLVVAEDPGHDGQLQGRGAVRRLRGPDVGLWPYASGLGPLDLAYHVEGVGAAPVAGEQRGDEPHLAVQQPGFGHVAVAPPCAQLGVRDRVEGACGHLVAQPQDAQPRPQFGGRLACEGEGQHPPGIAAAGERPPCDAAGQDTCLPGPRPCVDRQGQRVGGDRMELCLVEACEQGVGGGPVCRRHVVWEGGHGPHHSHGR